MSHSKRGLLIVDHGTRAPAGDAQLAGFASAVGEQRRDWLVRHAHMEIASPGFLEGVDGLVALGATEILIHLHFLGVGFHVRESIPELVAQARAAHPGIPIETTAPLGEDVRLVEIVLGRMDAHSKQTS